MKKENLFDKRDPRSKLASIFERDSSLNSHIKIEEIQKMYQDLSLDDQKTSFGTRSEVIRNNLELKYLTSREYYNTKIINDVIYNENTHIVSVFKDYLIFDDVSEFLKRQYVTSESKKRLPKVIEFYETYSKVFPNYVNLPENKFMFKNIERKQLYWDSKQQFLMDQEERNAKKKARIEDFGGVQNAPSSFFNESIDDKMFNSSFVDGINNMRTLPDNEASFMKIVTVKNEYDSRVLDISHQEPAPKSAALQLEKLIKGFAERDTSIVQSKSILELSGLSRDINEDSIFQNKINDPEVSDFFRRCSLKQKEQEIKKKQQERNNQLKMNQVQQNANLQTQRNSQLHQYNENRLNSDKIDQNPKRTVKPQKNDNAVELISKHYNNGKPRTARQIYDKSAKPGSDNKVIVNSGTLIRHLRTTDSSEMATATRIRETSDKKVVRASPFQQIREKK